MAIAQDSRKAFYFSFDALIAATVVFFALATVMQMDAPDQTSSISTTYQRADTSAEDALQLAMQSRLRDAVSVQEQEELINDTVLEEDDLEASVMDAIAILWASNETSAARNLSKGFFRGLVPPDFDYRVRIGDGAGTVIYSSSETFDSSSLVARATRMVSGVSRNRPTRGFSAKASLTDLGAIKSEYFFFGGYVGDGTITANITLPAYRNIVATELEGDFSGRFNLSVNGDPAGSYEPSATNLSADTFTVCNLTYETGRCGALEQGDNEVRFEFTGNGTSIGGGFVRVDYNRSESLESRSDTYTIERDEFPGIEGIINLFGSFHVPGTLHGMEARLHYETNSTVFFKIGNVTVYSNTSEGAVDVTLDNETIASSLQEENVSLDELSNETVPYRLGVRNLSETDRDPADSVPVIDVSGSMQNDNNNDGTSLLDEAKNASKMFVDSILEVEVNRAGMVAYESTVDAVHPLSKDEASIKDSIDSLKSGGNTCIGCGILEATEVVSEPSYVQVVSRGAQWRWNASYPDSSPPDIDGENWTVTGYNDSGWGRNETIAGLGGNVDTTLPVNGGDYYFRKTFQWSWSEYNGFQAFLRSDDAADVYINGKLVDNDTRKHDGRYWNRVFNGLRPMFEDSYERGSLGGNWTITGGAEGDEVKLDTDCGATEGSTALILRWGGATVESKAFDLSDEAAAGIEYDFKQGGGGGCEQPEAGEDVIVEYLDVDGNWQQLKEHPGGGSDPSRGSWTGYSHNLPDDALHSGLKVRFRYPSGSGSDYDYWAVDDFTVGNSIKVNDSILQEGRNTIAVRLKDDGTTAFTSWVTETTSDWEKGGFTNTTAQDGDLLLAGRETVFTDGFEDGDLAPWTCSGDGVCGVSTSCAISGTYSAYHGADSGQITSPASDLGSYDGANLSYAVRKGDESCSEDPDGNEDLIVEYLDSSDTWQQLEVIEVKDLNDGEVTEREVALPGDALHADFQVRFRQRKGSGGDNDYWHVDDIALESTGLSSSQGNYTSSMFDAGQEVVWKDAVVDATTPAGTNYSIDYSNGSQWYDTIDQVPDSRYIRFNMSLRTDDLTVTPRVDRVNISFEGPSVEFDFELNASEYRNRSMVVMSDGEANRETSMSNVPDHDGDGDVDAKDHTIEAACRAWQDHEVRVFTVGFGGNVDNQTLQLTADCGNGKYFFAEEGKLAELFDEIAQNIVEATEKGQELLVKQGVVNDTLFSDSSLTLNYSSPRGLEFGRFRISQASNRFGGNVTSPKNGSFDVPAETELLDARLLSYSSNYWTDRVTMENGTGQHEYVYRLWKYGADYDDLGDPYNVHLPPEKATVGARNNVSVDTAFNRTTTVGGSNFSRVVYDLMIDGFVGYGDVFNKSEGGTRNVTTDYGSFELEVGNASDPWEPNGDAADNATERLLNKLDVDDDGSVDFQIDSDNLNIDQNSLSGLKWLWGPAIVSVEVWEE